MSVNETRLIEAALADLGQVGMVWRFSDAHIDFHGDAAGILGILPNDVPQTASAFKSLINPQDLPTLMTALQDHAAKLDSGEHKHGVRVSEPFRVRMRDGNQQTMRLEGRIAGSADGSPVLCGILLRDENIIQPHSNLLPSRGAIAASIEELLLTRSAGIRNRGYFMALGLDRVGLLNAAHGAAFVDSVLIEVEKRLASFLEHKARVGRLAGDEYGLIFDDLPHGQADALAASLLQLFTGTPILTLHGPVMIGLSIGGAALNNVDEKGSDVVARAEAALREAKRHGRGCFSISSSLDEKRDQARKLLAGGQAVYRALEEGRMRMAFQPVVDTDSKTILFYESLIRMVDENGKIVPADQFIPSLEELGMMRMLDVFSLHCAVRELVQFPDISISVNVSNLSLVDAGWLRAAVSLMGGKPSVASRLIVEITESSVMDDIDAAVRIVRTLKDLGCQIALDDFGAGQTSFRQLKMLEVDIVKIDKSYIRNINEPVNQMFVKSLLELASGLSLQAVAEGAETESEAELLRDLGLRYMQGFAFGFPSIERVWLPKGHEMRTQKSA